MKKQLFVILTFILIFSIVCSAHPGRTDKHGGHTNKATGEYHFHNPDGSVTVGTKPQESSSESVSTESTAKETTSEESNIATEPESTPSMQTDTIIVDNTEKPLQKEVIESIAANKPAKETEKAKTTVKSGTQSSDNTQEVIETKEINEIKEVTKNTNNNNDTYIYIPAKQTFADLSHALIVILSLFALLGFCIFSTFMCLIFKKIEKSGSVWQAILHVPYLIFWLPSLLGNLIFKLYYRVIPSDELDSLNDDEEDDYEI